MIEFLADGTVKYSPGAIVEFTYTFDGQKVVLKSMDPDQKPLPDQVLTVPKLSLNKMTVRAATSEEWTRVGEAEDRGHPLLGDWTAPRDMDGQTRNWKFRADGSGVLTVPFSRMIGQYELTKGFIRFRLKVGGAPSVEGPISWEGDILLLPGERSPMKLHRF